MRTTPSVPDISSHSTLSREVAFFLQASMVVFFLAGSSAPTAMYALYQAAWGFSPITITVIFGIYALAVLATLLVAGSLSDHLGRRPVLLATALVQVVAMVVYATAGGVRGLLLARVIQGIGTGAAMGAASAGLLDLQRERGTLANSISPMVGVATGALFSGLFVRYLAAPTHLLYGVLGTVFLAQAVLASRMPETVSPRPGAWASLRPRIHVPPRLRRAVLVAAPALVSVWALAGFYGSLGPALVRKLMGSTSPLLGGLALATLSASGALVVIALRRRDAHTVAVRGLGALVAGLALVQVAAASRSASVFFAATALAGAGFGASFQGSLRSVLELTHPHERAGVFSVLFVVAYLSMGVPAIFAGIYLASTGDVIATAEIYALALMTLALLALVGRWAYRPHVSGALPVAVGNP